MEINLGNNDLEIFHKNNQLRALIDTLESDRKGIAQNLHNDISSKLNVISLNCHLLKIPNLPQKDLEEITNNIIEYTAKALISCKDLTYSLLPPVLEKFGLHAGMEELCDELRTNKAIDIQYVNNISFDFKENDKHIHVFRILQELLSNSILHGKATLVSIRFDEIEGKKICEYSDNGIGFENKEIENSTGNGMKNIQSRVTILQGNLSVESSLNAGVSVSFNF